METEEITVEEDVVEDQQSLFPDMPDWIIGFPAAIPTPDEEAELRELGEKQRAEKAAQEKAHTTPVEEVKVELAVTEDE